MAQHHDDPIAMRRAAAALAAALGLGLGLAGAAALRAEPQARSFRQSFPAGPGAVLRLANLAGQVELVAGSGNQVVIDATVHAEFSGAGETQRQLQEMRWVKAADGKGREEWALSYPVERYHSFFYPRPRDKEESSFWSLFDNSSCSSSYRGERVRVYTGRHSSAPTLYADLRIALPAMSDLALRNLVGKVRGGALEGRLSLDTGNGDIQLDAFAGQLRLDTGSGDVVLGTSRGETAIDTGSGDVVVRQLVGNANIDTGSGDVRIGGVQVGKLRLHTGSVNADTGSGDVEVASSLDHTRRLVAKTGSGDVSVYAGPSASFDVTADQGSGDLRVDYADAVLRRANHRDKVVGARRGDGRTTIRIETSSGDCVIRPRRSGDGESERKKGKRSS